MGPEVIEGTPQIAEAIKFRRMELGLTIEAAAKKAGIGTKTWCRYEAGGSIRIDKVKGVCRALNWPGFPENDVLNDTMFDIEEFRNNEAWSEYLATTYGEPAAVSFVVGSEILLDHIEADLEVLSQLPRGTHIGQLDFSALVYELPEQFLMRYDYEFVYCLRATVRNLISMASHNSCLMAHSVMQELAFFLIYQEADAYMEALEYDIKCFGKEEAYVWDDWVFEMFGDMDIITYLYSDMVLPEGDEYHFDSWNEEKFYMKK